MNYSSDMMLPNSSPSALVSPAPHGELFLAVLEQAEIGVVVVDGSNRAVYVNWSAHQLLDTPDLSLPEWVMAQMAPLLEQLRLTGTQVVEKWAHDELVLRVRGRRLDRTSGLTVLELSAAPGGAGRQVVELLARSLHLSPSDARLLALLWRGMSNDEIADRLAVRVGTVKSRLFRLYQKLGVKRRSTAVLRAAEVLVS